MAFFWNSLSNENKDLSKTCCIFIVLCHKMLVFPFPTLEQHITLSFCQNHDAVFMENYHWIIFNSVLERISDYSLSNLNNHNHSAAKKSQVLCSTEYAKYEENAQYAEYEYMQNMRNMQNSQIYKI